MLHYHNSHFLHSNLFYSKLKYLLVCIGTNFVEGVGKTGKEREGKRKGKKGREEEGRGAKRRKGEGRGGKGREEKGNVKEGDERGRRGWDEKARD